MAQHAVPFVVYAAPVFGMIALVFFVENDYLLTAVYALCIFALFSTGWEKHDLSALLLGMVGITLAEIFFVSTGVETFSRTSLLGLMPLWLPLLWGYAFVSIKRYLAVLNGS